MPGISGVQITFYEDRAPEHHAMPPGAFRLAVINGLDLASACTARKQLKAHFAGKILGLELSRSAP
jgi:hypothetical protein